MRILLIGKAGTIGQAIANDLGQRHEIISIGRSSGEFQADISKPDSLRDLFEKTHPYDAIICAAGEAAFGPLEKLSDEDFQLGLRSKLMGQVNLVRMGTSVMADGGSFTLSSGILSQHPTADSSAISLVNSGIEGFARAAALGLPRSIRINVVSPPWVRETMEQLGMNSSTGLPASDVAKAYAASVEGTMTGEIIDARDFAGA